MRTLTEALLLNRPARHMLACWRITTIEGTLHLEKLVVVNGRERWRVADDSERLECPQDGWYVSDAASDEWDD